MKKVGDKCDNCENCIKRITNKMGLCLKCYVDYKYEESNIMLHRMNLLFMLSELKKKRDLEKIKTTK